MLSDCNGRRHRFVHAQDVDCDGGARRPEDRPDQRCLKKRRSGGGEREPSAKGTGSDYNALIPEDEWCYVVTQIAQAFGQDWWGVYNSREPHLTWFSYYHLEGAQRIEDLRREIDDLDRAMMTAYAFNDTKGLDERRRELKARLRNDPAKPAKPQFTREEMQAAAQRLVTSVITTGKLPPRHIQ